MRVLVCGSRDLEDFLLVDKHLTELHNKNTIRLVIQGGADGADQLAKDWAHMNCVPCLNYPANWSKYKKKAGPIRNQEMLDYGRPHIVLAFPLDHSIGTYDMIRRAKAAGIEVIEIKGETI